MSDKQLEDMFEPQLQEVPEKLKTLQELFPVIDQKLKRPGMTKGKACILGYKVMYYNMAKLLAKLKMLKADGSYLREITQIEKKDLLIIDDFGLQPLDNQSRLTFLEIIEDRHEHKSSIFTSQVPVEKRYEIIGDKAVADAILDRLVYSSHRIELKVESYRKRKSKNSE